MMKILTSTVSMYTDELTDQELAALHLCVIMDGDPHGRIFDYEKVEGMFTENNGTKMHESTKVALDAVVNMRLGG